MKLILVIWISLFLGACATPYGSQGQKAGGDTVFLCHKGKKTMEMPREAVDAHLGHGDHLGACS